MRSSKPARPASPSKRGSPAPRRPGTPGRGSRSSSSFPWQWLALGGGGLLLLGALIFGGRALFVSKATPTPFLPTATPPTTPQLTETPAVDEEKTPDSPSTPAGETSLPPDVPTLQRLMLRLINENRRAQGLSEVAWDETAALAGTQHAQEMAQYGYISHRNLDGYGPEHRYAMAGGTHYVMENVHVTWHSSGGEPRSADAWEAWVRDAQASLMESELHRANILAPEHTHVGIGMAYDPATGYFSIAQEFVNQYTTVQPPLLTASLGQQMELVGWLNAGVSNPLLNIAYEPLPVPLSLDELQPESYASQAESYAVPDVSLAADGKFTSDFTLNHEEQPGLYHIRLWVDTEFGNVQAVNLVIRVQ